MSADRKTALAETAPENRGLCVSETLDRETREGREHQSEGTERTGRAFPHVPCP